VLVARACERAVDLAVAEERGGIQRGMTFAVADPRIGAGREQAPDFAQVAACDRGMKQRVSERTLPVGIA
jgi:hypothetical protein